MQIIYLDISSKGVVPTIYAKQGDVGRKFEVVFTDSGLPYTPANGYVFSVWYSGASGEGNYTDIGDKSAFSVNGNKVIVEMITQMLSNEGEGILCLVLNDSGGNQIGLWNIRYVCEPVPGAESEEAKTYYSAFSESVKKLSDTDAILRNKLSVDGTNTMEANLPMGGHKVTGLDDPAANGDAVNLGFANAHYAPANYGIGKLLVYEVTGDDGLDAKLIEIINGMGDNTFKRVKFSFYAVTSLGGGGHYYADIYKLSANYAMITLKSYIQYGRTVQRVWFAGQLYPWEWPDPFLKVDTEYRTTERHNEKPVYKKLISFTNAEALSGVMSMYVPHEISNLGMVLSVDCTTNGYLLPYVTDTTSLNVNSWDANNIVVYNGGSSWSAGRTWYFTVRYTKTTD